MTNRPDENAHWKKLPVLTETIDETPARIPILTEEVAHEGTRPLVQPETIAPSDSVAQEALISLTAEQCLHFYSGLASKIATLFHDRFAVHAEWTELHNTLPDIIRTQLIESSTDGFGIIPPSFNKPIQDSAKGVKIGSFAAPRQKNKA
jgi:hypothetical protein